MSAVQSWFTEEEIKEIMKRKRRKLLKKTKIFGEEAHIYGRANAKKFLVYFPNKKDRKGIERGELGLLWKEDGRCALTSVAYLKDDNQFWYSYGDLFENKGIVETDKELSPVYMEILKLSKDNKNQLKVSR